MIQKPGEDTEGSPFHRGEQQLQARAGKRAAVETLGRRVIRDYMPEQHRRFYARLPFLVVGAVDSVGNPWATLLAGSPGFISSPDSQTLRIDAQPAEGDATREALQPGQAVGLLGIELNTRRRNRMNGHVIEQRARGFSVQVDQAFGNCPQYIHSRHVLPVESTQHLVRETRPFDGLPLAAVKLVQSADTLFVASHLDAQHESGGVDVSHRGGPPGFVQVEDHVLTVPDYPGNNHFNTLGNFLLNPRGGLVFPDFDSGDLLQLTGTVELLPAEHAAVTKLDEAIGAWRFTVSHGRWLRHALPYRFDPI